MAKYGRIRRAVDRSIRYGKEQGRINPERDAAPIAMIQHLANILDSDAGESSIMRYVSPSMFLSYCEKLGFTPPEEVKDKKPEKKPDKKISLVVGQSKWKIPPAQKIM